jgi:hypothetical protein
MRILNSAKACYHLAQNLFSSFLLHEHIKIKMFKL